MVTSKKTEISVEVSPNQIWKRKKYFSYRSETLWLYVLVLAVIEKGLPNNRWKQAKLHSWDPIANEAVGGITCAGVKEFSKHYEYIGTLPLSEEIRKKIAPDL